MKDKAVLLILGLFILLGCIFFFASRQWKQADEAAALSDCLLPVDADAVTTVRLKNPSGVIELTKTSDNWNVVYPVEAAADSNEVAALLNYLSSLSALRTFEDVTDQQKQEYGLTKRDVQISLDAEGQSYAIWTGKDSTVAGRLYAMKSGDPRVLISEIGLRDCLLRSLYNLRDKDVFKFSTPEVTRIEWQQPDRKEWAEKDAQGVWQMSQTADARADENKVAALLSQLRTQKIMAFDDDATDDPAVFGLTDSATKIAVFWGEDNTPEVLLLGRSATDEARLYAMQQNGSPVFELPSTFLVQFEQQWNDLRDRSLVSTKAWQCDRVEVSGPEGVIFSASESADSNWQMLEPAEGILDSEKLIFFLQSLTGLQIEAFLDQPEPLNTYRLDPPDYRVNLKSPDGIESLPFSILPPSATDEFAVDWVYSKRPDEVPVLAIDRYFVTLIQQDFRQMLTPSELNSVEATNE